MSAASRVERLTVLANAWHGGGAEFVGRTWAQTFAAAGEHADLVVLETPREPVGLAIPVRGLGDGWWRRIRALRRVVDSGPGHVVLSLQMTPNLLLLIASATVPRARRATVVVSERNIVSINAVRPSRRHRVRVGLAKRLYRRADLVVAISHPVAAELVAGFGVRPERCRVVPNPAATEARPVSTPADGVDVELILVGRLVPQKQPHLALEVLRELRSRGHRVTLTVFGDGPQRALFEGVEGVDLRGWVEDWPALCHVNSVLLLPSVKEGFGNVLVEAAAARIPSVAASGALGVADAIVSGVTGVLAADDSVSTLADGVLAAARCDFVGVEPWLARFTPQGSAAVLRAALGAALEYRCAG